MPRSPESDDQSSDSWSLETACQNLTKTTIMKNQNDPTCASYVYCYFGSNGPPVPLVKTCKSNTYFDDTIKICTTIKPDSCTSDNQNSESWSLEKAFPDITKYTVLENQDDPTCTSYAYSYVGKTDYSISLKVCVSTKPNECEEAETPSTIAAP
ncbi:uncharacterized protein [Drosophila takahashii]|uniref:uncharacterized protein n=1 Tax=Drosophila takahashii TaxID=29030 RepID=UPI0038996CAA